MENYQTLKYNIEQHNHELLKVFGVTRCSSVDGPGLRTVVWFQGCRNHCPGCHNPDSWDMDKAVNLYTTRQLLELTVPNKLEDGLTLSGGDPLWQKSLRSLDLFITGYKFCNQDKSIWLYTGLTFEELVLSPVSGIEDKQSLHSILSTIDVLVDGRFKQELMSKDCLYRGSTNQRLLDSKASMKAMKPILFDEKNIKV